VDHKGKSMFAARILDVHPLLPVEDEERLNDALLRETFVEQIFAHARLRALLESDWRVHDLISFHARHKMQMLAQAGVRPREELAADYARVFGTAFATKTTIGRNVNVLQHCMGMMSASLDPARRADLAEVIAFYQAGRVALSVPATLLRHHARGKAAKYVRDQTYFSSYPEEFHLRNHVPA
jgi:uncharacterized protein YbgA (DUF1722 family)